MHSFARYRHSSASKASATETKGLILRGGWRTDLHGWFMNTFLFRGQGQALRQRSLQLADLHPGEQILDVGCGKGTLALEVARRGSAGRVAGIDPSSEQIARARRAAARRNAPIEFQIGVIEQLPFPEATFDVVLSTLMMHHVPAPLKRQGLSEIARVLKPGGRLVIADFTHHADRAGRSARFHAGGSRLPDLVALVTDAGFERVETEEMSPARFSAFPGASIIRAAKNDGRHESAQIL